MQIDEDIIAFAVADVALRRLVSDRVSFELMGERDTLPAVTIETVTDEPARHMGGRGGLTRYEYRVRCWGRSRVEASNVRQAWIECFDEYRGQMGRSVVPSLYCENASDEPAGPDQGVAQQIPCLALTMEVWVREFAASAV